MGRKDKIKYERKTNPSTPRLPPKINSEKYINQGPNDLFEGALAKAALASLSEEDKEKYRILGEKLYGNVDFEGSGIVDNSPSEMIEALAFVENQLRSGMHPSVLEDNEKMLLEEFHGKEWYKKWNYIKEDLDDMVTVNFNFNE